MIRWALLSASLLTSPAWAVQFPTPLADENTICDINFNADQVVGVPAIKGYDIEIRFAEDERIAPDGIALSNQLMVDNSVPNGSANILHLRALVGDLQPQPIHIRTVSVDGQRTRDYPFLFYSFMSEAQANAPEPEPPVVAVATGKPATPPKKRINFCYVVRFHYPVDVKAQAAANWRAKKKRDEAEAAELALHKADAARLRNSHYVAQGDASIAPTEVWDDGNTTTLIWPGNLSLPVLFESRAK